MGPMNLGVSYTQLPGSQEDPNGGPPVVAVRRPQLVSDSGTQCPPHPGTHSPTPHGGPGD